jgi:hypothetical protein
MLQLLLVADNIVDMNDQRAYVHHFVESLTEMDSTPSSGIWLFIFIELRSFKTVLD